MARPARNNGSPLDSATPVVLHLELRAQAEDAARLISYATAFCDTHRNATLHQPRTRPRHLSDTTVVAYIAIDGGPLSDAVRGEAPAQQATLTFAAAVTELFMFDPVLVSRPRAMEPPAAEVPDRPGGAP